VVIQVFLWKLGIIYHATIFIFFLNLRKSP